MPPVIPGTRIVWTGKDGKETDLPATIEMQSKWNKIAAVFASIAALLQAVQVVLP
ncbi:hypothetical protein TUM18999_46860 [Pseudomonas tohonis]|uniref:Uncharacterized protein n=1 Tax=Pseudomonas tohonis TaxID=2725477 RepID=A0A6J4EAR1_9PSED|nr:hypothetical protein TUM18999_46860 [Pseudomonas tohonis]